MSADRYQRADDMVRDADTAMYRAKALGKARCEVFDTSMLAARRASACSSNRICGTRSSGSELRGLLPADRRRSPTAQLCGFEALLRWHHPERGLVLAGRVHPDRRGDRPHRADRPLGAARGLPADARVGRGVSRAAATSTINVNLSARQCMRAGPACATSPQVLAETGLAPERLKLEITEGVVLENSDDGRRRS